MSVWAMADRIQAKPAPEAPTAPGGALAIDRDEDARAAGLRAIIAYIPSEGIAAFLALIGIGAIDTAAHWWPWVAFSVGALFIVLVLVVKARTPSPSRDRSSKALVKTLSVALFAYWLYTVATPGGPWQGELGGVDYSVLAGFFAPLVTTLLALLAPVLGIEAPRKASQVIQWAQIADKRLGDPSIELTAVARPSDLRVEYHSKDESVCTVIVDPGSGKQSLELLAVGTCTVTAEQPGTALYKAAKPVVMTFAVEDA